MVTQLNISSVLKVGAKSSFNFKVYTVNIPVRK